MFQLAKFLNDQATKNGFRINIGAEAKISHTIGRRDYKNIIDSGYTYGFCVDLDDDSKRVLFEEAMSAHRCALELLEQFVPIIGNTYPLYWGRERYQTQRLYAHLNGYKNNGGIRLYKYASLNTREINYASVSVDQYVEFETYLRSAFPDLLRTFKE